MFGHGFQTRFIVAYGLMGVLMGCGPDGGPADWGGAAGSGGEIELPAEQVEDAAPAFEPFEISIEQSVTVGAFILDLGSARVTPGEGRFDPYVVVAVDFLAHNQAEVAQVPHGGLDFYDGLLLEAGDQYVFGQVMTDLVPGERTGKGVIEWSISDIDPDALRTAKITFGAASGNQAFLDLGDPTLTRDLADIPLDTTILIEGYRQTTVDLGELHVQYNRRSANQPLPSGTAILVLEGTLSADADMSGYGEYWSVTNMFLERPDGISVSPESLTDAVYPGDRENVAIIFELQQPLSGTYTFGVVDRDLAPVTREIVIP